MRKILKLISALVAVVLMLTMVSASASTNYEVMDEAIYIASASVPEEATAYALDMFSLFDVSILTSIGFTENEANNLKMAQGICANIIDDASDDSAIFFYPVLCGNEILAMITLSWLNDQYNFQFGRSLMAETMNDIETTQADPARIFVSSNAYYCVTNSGVIVLDTIADADSSEIDNEISALVELSMTNNGNSESTVTVGENSALSASTNVNSARTALTSVCKDVAIVSNETVTDSTGSHGACWAAASGSIADYYLNGCATSMAETNKWFMLQLQLDSTGSYVAGKSAIKYYIEALTGATMKITGLRLSWNQVITAILVNNAPCCTILSKTSGETGQHALVLCGYYYSTTDASDSDYYFLRVMDPNHVYYQIVPFTSEFVYTVGSNYYYWSDSIIRT